MAGAALAAGFAKDAAIFMGKTAAGAAISYLVNKALGRLSAEDGNLHRSLKEKLPVIQAIFDAGDHELVRERYGDWLGNFRDAMQEAEDALDELESLDLEKEVRDRRSGEAKGWKASVSSRFSNIRSGFRRTVSAATTGGTPKRLKDALEGLDSVLGNAGDFLSVTRNIRSSSSDTQDGGNTHETTRELTTTAIFGRLEEKKELLEWLGVHTSAANVDHRLLVCAIVGGGGMGKTTLAQFICQDKMVQDHFGDKIVWVHVSKRFEPKVLVRRILESINRDKVSAEALDSLQSDLTKQLLTTRFLLVLDDAWEDIDDTKWEQFLGPLRNNSVMGGRILLTTRMRSVFQAVKLQMQAEVKLLELRGLDPEDTLKLFNHYAFGDSIPSDRFELQLIGKQIAEKLKGCPFIAKVIGQQLRDSSDPSRWNAILDQDIHQFDAKIMEMLKLSYQNLTYEVQLCFQYCSIFPPDHKFKMEDLIEMWVGSGLIMQREKGTKSQEVVAREHFSILAKKSFFSLVPRELLADPSEDYYVMHDLMYDLARSVSSDEFSRSKNGEKVRHLFIHGVNSEAVKIISQSKYLRTLIIANEEKTIKQNLVDDLKKAIKGRTSLRVLKLHGHGWFGMNDVVAELKHLRYIYMSATDEPNLFKLFKLYHLEVLKIIAIENEEKASPIDIGNLPCLRKLSLPKNTLSRIPHIGRLTTLQELNGFSVKKKDGHRITELQSLQNLRKVIVLDVQNVCDCNEAYAAKLDKKANIKILSLGWSDGEVSLDAQILTELVPHRNLMHLIISGYNGIKPPNWMEHRHLFNLVHLKLNGCVELIELPILGNLHALKHVSLTHLPKLERIPNSPSHIDGSGELPPHLVTFVVKACPLLSRLPVLPFSLQSLWIDAVGISSLPRMSDVKTLRGVPSLEPQLSVLRIESCDLLSSLDGCFLQEEHYKALTVLKLFCCHELSSLPHAALFERISKLESVEIDECNSLLSLGGLGALSRLKVLKIVNCGHLFTTSSPGVEHLKLETLEIDDHELLISSPLRNLCMTKRLIILCRSEMAFLPERWLLQNKSYLEYMEIRNAEYLQSLPSEMHNLDALRSLLLHNAPLLQSLPSMPTNMCVLTIKGCCNELEQCLTRGPERSKISWIRHCDICPKQDDRRLIGCKFVGSSS